MSKSEEKLREMLHKVDFIPYAHGPENLVLVTVDDVIEIMRELIPYTMQKLDEVNK